MASLLQVGDFNFDGFEDVAILNSNFGGYGGPTYTVFLWSSKTGTFGLSPELSRMTEETLGFLKSTPRESG